MNTCMPARMHIQLHVLARHTHAHTQDGMDDGKVGLDANLQTNFLLAQGNWLFEYQTKCLLVSTP